MSFDDPGDDSWLDELGEELDDDTVDDAEDGTSGEGEGLIDAAASTLSDRIREHMEGDASEEDDEEEEFDDVEVIETITEIEDSPYHAPENQRDEDWELAHHFDFGIDSLNYVAGVPIGVLWIVWNEDGSADVFVDRDYGDAAA